MTQTRYYFARMPKLLAAFFLLAAACALELDAAPRFSAPAAPAIRELALTPAENEDAADYSFNLDSMYAPGQTVTFNVQKNRAELNVSAVTVELLGQHGELREYEKDSWTGYFVLPQELDEGALPVTISLRGHDYAADEPAEINIVYPISEIVLKSQTAASLPPTLNAIVRETILLQAGDFYSAMRAEVNRQRIFDLGFFEKVEVERATRERKSQVIFSLRENPVLKNIRVTGNRALTEAEILAVMELKPGEILATRQLQKDMLAVEKLYSDKEYTFARIASIERPAKNNAYTLTLRISEGEIGRIRILGNDVTQTKVITRETELKSGDIFNAALLRDDFRSIYNLNYFSLLMPDVRVNEETGKIDLDWKVEEKKTSSINFGGGYGQVQGWFGFADLLLDNIMGSGQSLLLKASFGEKLTSYQVRYHNPWMWDNKTSFTGRLWSTYGYNYLSAQRELRNGWSTAVGFRKTKYVSETYSFRYEDVFNIDDRTQDYQDRAVGYSIAYDSRDQWMNPTTGQHAVFSMDHSAKLLGGSINASRYSAQYNHFHPLAEKQVLAFRTMYDYQLGDIFPAEQYYVGSDSTVRGYQSIFAKGNERIIFNLEYRYIFTEMFVGALFYDIGQATQPVYDPLDADRDFTNRAGWGSAQGFGVRIITPMGPIRLDYGWPDHKEFADGFLSFNMGNTF
ncbi:putative surface antigen [Candidatus Termititenax aidoneus]|uniref:Surface antigen n=1 Tax=Termititenax aidoneus TaxID=2218524 RepID=A0A388TC11_TERA1|nr:putative surface antigen [Candidatus Termititenax aidoneus]